MLYSLTMNGHTNAVQHLTVIQYLVRLWETTTYLLICTEQAEQTEQLFPALRKAYGIPGYGLPGLIKVQSQLEELFAGLSAATIGQLQVSSFIDGVSAALPATPRICPLSQSGGAESLPTGLTPRAESLCVSEEHAPSRRPGDRDLLNDVVESFRQKVALLLNELDEESSKLFVSRIADVCKLPTPDFTRAIASFVVCGAQPLPGSLAARTGVTVHNKKERIVRREIWKENLDKFTANAVRDLIQLVQNHWDDLTADTRRLPSAHKQTSCSHYHELHDLKTKPGLYWFQHALALMRLRQDYTEFLEQNREMAKYTTEQVIRVAFLKEVYVDNTSGIDLPKVRKTFSNDLRFAQRWMFFVKALGGPGAVVVCGEAISKLV